MKGAIAVAGAAILWGFWGLIVRSSGADGPWAAAIALTTISVAGLPLVWRRVPRGRRLWGALVAIGICDAANNGLFFAALDRGPVATGILTHYLAPLCVALMSPIALGMRPRPRTWVAMALSLGGLALLLGTSGTQDALTAALGAASAIFYAANILISKRFSDRIDPAGLLVWHAYVSALVVWPFALFRAPPSMGGVAMVVGAGLVCGIGGGVAFLWGLRRVAAARAGVLTYFEPLVGILVGVFILHEPMAPLAPLGAALILGAGLLVVTDSAAQG